MFDYKYHLKGAFGGYISFKKRYSQHQRCSNTFAPPVLSVSLKGAPMNFRDVHLDPNCYIAPNCTLIGSVHVGEHSSIFPGVTVRGDRETVTIGKNTNVQENAIMHVETDFPCTLGDNVTIGHGTIIHACTIEHNCIIGMGATVMDGAIIGENSVVGAGAVVSKGVIIPPQSIVMGLPGKVVRPINEAERAYNQQSADDYSDNARELTEAGFFLRGSEVPSNHPTIALAQ